jgi:hypothetical protein
VVCMQAPATHLHEMCHGRHYGDIWVRYPGVITWGARVFWGMLYMGSAQRSSRLPDWEAVCGVLATWACPHHISEYLSRHKIYRGITTIASRPAEID